jgi:hypothetical protein
MRRWYVPKGPNGEKRPADAVGLAVMIGKIATGEIEDTRDDVSIAAAQMGKLGGKARAAALTPERRSQIARKAATRRWEESVALVPEDASEKQDQ